MRNKTAVIAVFVFLIIVMFFIFPRGCPQTGGGATLGTVPAETVRSGQ